MSLKSVIQNLAMDNADDRRELHSALDRLRPVDRVRFLVWACRDATLDGSKANPGINPDMWKKARLAETDSSADRQLSIEIYFDLWALATQYDFSLDKAATQLEKWAGKGGRTAGDMTGPRKQGANVPESVHVYFKKQPPQQGPSREDPPK
jgi:hypothetical protein